MLQLFVILFLILLNGIFAMAEIAMISSRKSRLEKDAKKGNKAAKKALELHTDLSKFLSTIQIGITLIGILTGLYSGEKIEDDLENYLMQYEMLRPFSESIAMGIIVIILTFFSLVLGELVPKRIALSRPESIARLVAYPMHIISIIAMPFIWLLSFTTDLFIRILRIEKSKNNYVTEEEIKAVVQEGLEAGTVQAIEQDIVENVFYLGDRKINSLMTNRPDIEWLNIMDPVQVNKIRIASFEHKSFPVCNGQLDYIVGVIDSKDLLNAALNERILEFGKLIRPALFFPENMTAYKALEKFREAKQKMAMVVDEYGGIQGLLTMDDLIDALVGDLTQQLHEKKEIIPREDGTFLVDASVPLPEFARYFNIEILDKEELYHINTVGGLILHLGLKIPHAGSRLTWKNLLIEIIDMDGSRVDKILVQVIKNDES